MRIEGLHPPAACLTGAGRAEAGKAPAASPAAAAKLAELSRGAHAFESVLYKQMLHAMVEGSTDGGFFGQGAGSDTWEELFESGLSDSLGRGGGLGIANQIYNQFAETVRRQAESIPASAIAPTQSRPRGSPILAPCPGLDGAPRSHPRAS